MSRAVLAPGKAMLIGEYAVLEGAPAVVAAVDVYARAVLVDDGATSPFIEAAVRESSAALAELGISLERAATPRVDTSRFSHQGHKIGVGSSAAATVAAVGALFDAAGLDVTSAQHRELAYAVAKRAHDAAQGEAGSGADLLAAVHGGVLALGAGAPSRPLPATLVFAPTSTSVSTAQLVHRFREVRAAADAGVAQLYRASREFLAAWESGDFDALLAAVEGANAGYAALGRAMGQALLTDEHLSIAKAARRAGGTAKPSGAGGGDLAVAFFPTADAAKKFRAEIPTLSLGVSAQGLHVAN